jgi:hypothetical protein
MPCAVAGSNLSCYTLGCSKLYAAYRAGGASRHDARLIGEGGSVGLARRGRVEKHRTCCVTFVVNVGAALDVIQGSLRGRMFVRHRKRLEIVGLDADFAVQGCSDVRTSLVPAPTRSARLTSSNNKSMSMYSPSLSVGRMFRMSLCTVEHCQRSVRLSAMKITFREQELRRCPPPIKRTSYVRYDHGCNGHKATDEVAHCRERSINVMCWRTLFTSC